MSKKQFKGLENPSLPKSPAEQMISGITQTTQHTQVVHKEVKTAPARNGQEFKTRRVQLVVKPSLYDDLILLTGAKRETLNNLINVILTEYRDNNKELIEKYKDLIGE